MGKKNPSAIVAGAGFVSDLMLRLQRLVIKKGGTDEDLYRLVTPDGEDTLGQVAQLIVHSGGSELKPEPLLQLLGSVTVPATTEKFVAKDNFTVGDVNGLKISYLGDNFKPWFLEKIEEPVGASELRRHQLLRESIDGLIVAELGGEDKAETTLAEIHALMEKQGKGEAGPLLTNGYVNIFYVRDAAGVLRALGVGWDGGGWDVSVDSVGGPGRWYAGRRVFSRNSIPLAA